MKKLLDNLAEKARQAEPQNRALVKKLKKKKPKNLDDIVHALHEEVFSEIDCLTCANCCKSLGPRVTDNDIARLAKHLKLKPGKFIESYLRLDEDNDYVFKEMPCPFLMPDNYCMVYEHRPKACREYPHTDRKRFYQALDITLKNTATCPAVFEIMERLKQTNIANS
ncbi:MAG: YkgJ family cysteine cluster protein [Bacteroidetes bacterium]|nr:MAG: YkgJ family cysteine cluster protein [Bacteroidota bacterium]